MKDQTPSQYTGQIIDATSSREFADHSQAIKFFEIVKHRLENVNAWQSIAGEMLAKFTLVDAGGNDVQRPLLKGDHIKIDVPGPGSQEGQGYDWVQVESIQSDFDDNATVYGFTVRPSSNPKRFATETAHFYSDASTSTFLVKRYGRKVSAEIHDRNITPNTEAEHLIDKLRDVVVGAMGALTLSKIQWQSLTDGLISD